MPDCLPCHASLGKHDSRTFVGSRSHTARSPSPLSTKCSRRASGIAPRSLYSSNPKLNSQKLNTTSQSTPCHRIWRRIFSPPSLYTFLSKLLLFFGIQVLGYISRVKLLPNCSNNRKNLHPISCLFLCFSPFMVREHEKYLSMPTLTLLESFSCFCSRPFRFGQN